jgi:hypothetical protein
VLNCELIRIQWELSAFDVCLLVNVSKLFVLFLDSSELNSSLLCSIKEDVFSIWECHHQILEVLLL